MEKRKLSDAEYTKKRSALVPRAVRYTNKKHGKRANGMDPEQWNALWNKTFLEKMDELAWKHNLIKRKVPTNK